MATEVETSPREAVAMTVLGPDVEEAQFREFASRLLDSLLLIADLCEREGDDVVWGRPILGALLGETSKIEELLDIFNARNNRRWFPLREYIAGIRNFSIAAYKLVHVRDSPHRYRLTYPARFLEDTEEFLSYIGTAIAGLLGAAAHYSRDTLGLTASRQSLLPSQFVEMLPEGALPADRGSRRRHAASDATVMIATTFLRRTAARDLLEMRRKVRGIPPQDAVPEVLNEELLRRFENDFHNMQSHYDTYVAGTDLEERDPELPSLRGRISLTFHLFELSGTLLHLYERHLAVEAGESRQVMGCPVNPEELLERTMEYSFHHGGTALVEARRICQKLLRRYSEVVELELPIPRYRGFHVRPSTLIAKIVSHYGSAVSLKLLGEKFNAAFPLELFRANEKINALKRRRIAAKVAELPRRRSRSRKSMDEEVRRVVLELAQRAYIVIYEQPLVLEEMQPPEDGSLHQYVLDQITRLLALGKIDIEADITGTFVGDKRVLEDIRCLAECGYGEDRYGNNIPLPEKLSFLRR